MVARWPRSWWATEALPLFVTALLPLVTAVIALPFVLFLFSFRRSISTPTGRLHASLAGRTVAWLVGLLLVGMLIFAASWDGGPLYC